jgi:16S rRNA (adenine1518-N6/adenine1519-N6)-dimethyltransferase
MPNKKLGQHWLKDRLILEAIADSAGIQPSDTVLEIGPGLGTLTSSLLRRTKHVVAVEYDEELARKLPAQFPGTELKVIHADILTFDLSELPAGYRVVANVPYYITQKIVEKFLAAENKPKNMTLLIQKEVAEKLAATEGSMTAIAVKLQSQYNVHASTRVPKEYFTPPPMVDSQVVVCNLLHVENYVYDNFKSLNRVVDAGFSSPRKKLRSSLSGGLGVSKEVAEQLCRRASIDPEARASDIPASAWTRVAEAYEAL